MAPPREIGPYQILGLLGEGGMGAVYLGQDRRTGAQVAIKTLRAEGGAKNRERLAREYAALKTLDHPGVVRVLDAGEVEGAPWFAMERVEGSSLADRLRAGPLSLAEVDELVRQLSGALQAVHDQGLLHRDLKPDNVLCGPKERFVLTDFGLTKDLEVAAEIKLSRTGQLQGTPCYWAPEQARGDGGRATRETDIYGLGALVYAALTGRPPVEGSTWLEVVVATQETPPPAPRSLRLETPPALSAAILRALNKDPQDRFPSAQAFAAAAKAGPEGSGTRAPALLLSVVALVVLLAVGLALAASSQAEPTPAIATPLAPSPTLGPSPAPARLPDWFRNLATGEGPPLPLPPRLTPLKTPGRYRLEQEGSVFSWIPPGSFDMGSASGMPPPNRNEFPRHSVKLTRGYFLGIHEVSRAKFASFCRETGARDKGKEFARDEERGRAGRPIRLRRSEAVLLQLGWSAPP